MSDEFKQFWDTEVRPLADKCADGIQLLGQLEIATTDAEKDVIIKQIKSYGRKDWYAPLYISEMIFHVEHDLADGRNPVIGILQVRGCFNSEDYYKDVFKGQNSQESENYRALGEKLNHALDLLM